MTRIPLLLHLLYVSVLLIHHHHHHYHFFTHERRLFLSGAHQKFINFISSRSFSIEVESLGSRSKDSLTLKYNPNKQLLLCTRSRELSSRLSISTHPTTVSLLSDSGRRRFYPVSNPWKLQGERDVALHSILSTRRLAWWSSWITMD